MNKLLETITADIVVLETACYPSSYYGGYAWFDLKTGEWCPSDNATCNWYRTLDAARSAAKKLSKDTGRDGKRQRDWR